MDRWVLQLKNGFSIMDEDGWGRFIGNDGSAFDLDSNKHSEIIQRTIDEGERAVAPEVGEHLVETRPELEL